MADPSDLSEARSHLAEAESRLMTADGLFPLKEGLALLELVIDTHAGTPTETTARNLGGTYTDRIYARIGDAVERMRNLPEPDLEHLFAVIRAFDEVGFQLPPNAKILKVAIVRRLVDLYYEGYPQAAKDEIYAQLAELSNGYDEA
jgi:hypothetical protein